MKLWLSVYALAVLVACFLLGGLGSILGGLATVLIVGCAIYLRYEILDKTVPADSLDEWAHAEARLEGMFRAYAEVKPSWEDPFHPAYLPPPTPERQPFLHGVCTDAEGWIRVWDSAGRESTIDPRRCWAIKLDADFDWVQIAFKGESGYRTYVSTEPCERNGWWRCPRQGVCGRWNPPGTATCNDCLAAPLTGVLMLEQRIEAHNVARMKREFAEQRTKRAAAGKPMVLEGGASMSGVGPLQLTGHRYKCDDPVGPCIRDNGGL